MLISQRRYHGGERGLSFFLDLRYEDAVRVLDAFVTSCAHGTRVE